MKKNYILFALLSLFLNPFISKAQTSLTPGDIAIVYIEKDGFQNFAFVTFVNLEEETAIYFTNCGADVNGFSNICSEGARKYVAPVGGIQAGDIIYFKDENFIQNNYFFNYVDNVIPNQNFSLIGTGDQIIVFQDASNPEGSTNAAENPKFIFAVNMASTQFTGDKTTVNETGLPNGLSDTSTPRTALGLGSGPGPTDDWDNAVYNGIYDFSFSSDYQANVTSAKLAFSSPNLFTLVDYNFEPNYEADLAAIPSSINLGGTLSIQDVDLNNALSIYPTPSNGKITIKNNGVSMQKIQVSDINGHSIIDIDINGSTENKELDMTSVLTSGIYLIKIIANGNSIVKKLVIN